MQNNKTIIEMRYLTYDSFQSSNCCVFLLPLHTVYAADGAKKQKDKPLYSDSKNICTPQTLGNSASPMLSFTWHSCSKRNRKYQRKDSLDFPFDFSFNCSAWKKKKSKMAEIPQRNQFCFLHSSQHSYFSSALSVKP